MTQQEERYVHFASSTDKLNNAWRILREIKNNRGHPLVGPAFQFAIIEYSKPYTKSHGTVLTERGKPEEYRLKDNFIPESHRPLHYRLLQARHRIHAHDDLDIKEAKSHVVNSSHGTIVSTAENIIYATEELANIDEIIDLIEQTLRNMYVELKRLEESLPVTL